MAFTPDLAKAVVTAFVNAPDTEFANQARVTATPVLQPFDIL